MTKRGRKQKNANVQGEYEAVFQPDSDPQWQNVLGLGFVVCLALAEAVIGFRADDTWSLALSLFLSCSLIGVGMAIVLKNYWNGFLSFGITPKELTLLWDGQPVHTIPWSNVIEVFVTAGPCEWQTKYNVYYGVYVSLQYGYESRIAEAEKLILNLHISRKSMQHLEDFTVMRIYKSPMRSHCQQMAQKIEGYRNAAWAQSYEARTK